MSTQRNVPKVNQLPVTTVRFSSRPIAVGPVPRLERPHCPSVRVHRGTRLLSLVESLSTRQSQITQLVFDLLNHTLVCTLVSL
jgi:hypothetical protein